MRELSNVLVYVLIALVVPMTLVCVIIEHQKYNPSTKEYLLRNH